MGPSEAAGYAVSDDREDGLKDTKEALTIICNDSYGMLYSKG